MNDQNDPFLRWPRIWPFLLAAGLVIAAGLTGWTWAFGLASVAPALLGLKRWIFWSVED